MKSGARKKGGILFNCAASRRTVVLPRRDISRLNRDGRSATFGETPRKLFFYKSVFQGPPEWERRKKKQIMRSAKKERGQAEKMECGIEHVTVGNRQCMEGK